MDIPNSVKPEDLGVKLTVHTVEIDSVSTQADKFRNIVVGKVLETSKHPDADKLKLAKVDVGEKEPLKIVCKAPNLETGQTVVVALPGTSLPNGLLIEERQVRGEFSQGMMCAEDELGVGDDHSGIMVLEDNVRPGKPFSEYLKVDDVAFEVDNKSITNRPDLWGHLGIAREISAFLDSKTTKAFKDSFTGSISSDKNSQELNIKIENKEKCRRYSAVKIEGLSVKQSPKWVAERLAVAGMRPINNIVDATNYAMLELGQPLHAFDFEAVNDICVREAKKGEKIETLDGEERSLDTSMLVIAGGGKPIAIAGIMGGKSSEVNMDTKAIILESANFEPVNIRRTSSKLGLRSESSMRFEKSLDPSMTEAALAKCLKILKETCPKAKVASRVFDENNSDTEEKRIEVDFDRIRKRIGDDIPDKKIEDILVRLGFSVERSDDSLTVVVPPWRSSKDISIEEDIVEEVIRVYGYDRLRTEPPVVPMKAPLINEKKMLERKVKNLLARGARMNEVHNYSFTSEAKLKKLDIKPSDYISLVNPISNEHTLLRQNLFSNMLDSVRVNQAGYENISLFEIGDVYMDAESGIQKSPESPGSLPYQERRLSLVEASNEKEDIFRKLKGKVEYLLSYFRLDIRYEVPEMTPEWANKEAYAVIKVKDRYLGFIFQPGDRTLKEAGIKKKTALAELDFSEFFKLASSVENKKYKEPPKYPSIERDLAFVVDSKVLYNDIKEEIESFDELISDVRLFDIYQGENIGKDKKSLAFHISYRSDERTLRSEEVEDIANRLSKKLEEKLGAHIRDF